jgi:hypothetical protein
VFWWSMGCGYGGRTTEVMPGKVGGGHSEKKAFCYIEQWRG